MKIQCDVCNKEQAMLFCSADEAALCAGCDERVHHANKLAGKHHRFSLDHPTAKKSPLCDICQVKKAFLFCQQDRAILCKDCDFSIHKANEHTQKHNRFLLTGVKLSATSSLYSPSPTSTTSSTKNICNVVSNINNTKPVNKNSQTMTTNNEKALLHSSNNQLTSVSQYLMEMPGWHVEDLLDFSSPASFGLNKTGDDLKIWDAESDNSLYPILPSESFGIWVTQTPTSLYSTENQCSNIPFGGQVGYSEKEFNGNKSSNKWIDDNCFTVPQIRPSSPVSKRSRTYW